MLSAIRPASCWRIRAGRCIASWPTRPARPAKTNHGRLRQVTNHYFLTQLTGRDSNLRAGDADRERIAERLRKGHAEGRLDMAEFQERLEHCYAAKTFGELRALVRDLPREEASHGRGLLGQSPRRWRLAPLVPVLLVLFVVSA